MNEWLKKKKGKFSIKSNEFKWFGEEERIVGKGLTEMNRKKNMWN